MAYEHRQAGRFAYAWGVSDVTRILDRVQQGEAKASEELLPLVYEELRRLAAVRMAQLPPGQTLQPTALVHEAWLRLVGESDPAPHWNSRGHFFAAAAEAMRRILVERARRKAAAVHGGRLQRVDLNQVDVAAETDSDLLLLVDEAVTALAERNPTAAQLIKLRFFLGLPNVQAAEMLGMKLVYMDAGSGAANPVPMTMITKVKASVQLPLIIGGGITSADRAKAAFGAGADVVVVGNAIETDPDLITRIAAVR